MLRIRHPIAPVASQPHGLCGESLHTCVPAPPRAVLSVELLRLVRLPPARSCLTNATCPASHLEHLRLEPCVGLPLLAKPVVGTGEMSSVFEASERRVTFVPPQTSHGVNPARRRLDLFGLPPCSSTPCPSPQTSPWRGPPAGALSGHAIAPPRRAVDARETPRLRPLRPDVRLRPRIRAGR
jgi:hypothetical protein